MKLCDTCIYRNNVEQLKPCIIYRDNCEYYEKERMKKMTNEQAKAEIMQIYGVLSPSKQQALDIAIKALEQEPKWIPVSERLPNNHEYIKNKGLFNVSDGNRSYSEYFDIYDTERFGEPTMNGFRVDRCVVAWMPLPKPYEPKESEGV